MGSVFKQKRISWKFSGGFLMEKKQPQPQKPSPNPKQPTPKPVTNPSKNPNQKKGQF
jgi:hypothetical protein